MHLWWQSEGKGNVSSLKSSVRVANSAFSVSTGNINDQLNDFLN